MSFLESLASRVPGPPAAGAVHLWTLPLDGVGEAELRECEKLLTAEERARRDRYIPPRKKHEQTVTRALVRTLLGAYVGEPPSTLVFDASEFGKPRLYSPASALSFSISHCPGLVALAVSAGGELGLDVEALDSMTELDGVVDQFFAPSEAALILAIADADERRREFFRHWTLKEAYIKARGKGMSLPLNLFAVNPRGDGTATITIDPELKDDAKEWKLLLREPGPRHQLALAVRQREPVKLIEF